VQSLGQSMVTSRPAPQSIAQMFSPLAGQNRSARRFSHIGQIALPDNRFTPGKSHAAHKGRRRARIQKAQRT
jgi:hypothetical protein